MITVYLILITVLDTINALDWLIGWIWQRRNNLRKSWPKRTDNYGRRRFTESNHQYFWSQWS